MNYLKKSLMLAALMMPLSAFTAPIPRTDKGDQAEASSADLPGTNSEGHQMPAYVPESDFDLTGERFIGTRGPRHAADPYEEFCTLTADWPAVAREYARDDCQRRALSRNFTINDARNLVETYKQTALSVHALVIGQQQANQNTDQQDDEE